MPTWLETEASLRCVGFLDDYLKVSRQRSLGLRAKAKLIGQTAIAIVFAVLALQFPDDRGVTPASSFVSFIRDIDWLPLSMAFSIPFVIWVRPTRSTHVRLRRVVTTRVASLHEIRAASAETKGATDFGEEGSS